MSNIKFYWDLFISLPACPVYMEHSYQNLFASYDKTDAKLVKIIKNNEIAWLPLLVRTLESGNKEAYSAYGYGGIIGKVQLSSNEVVALCNFLYEASIISVFIRNSPFLTNENAWPENLQELNRYTYSITLNAYECIDNYLKKIPQKLRWSVNFARRSGLSVDFFPLLDCAPSFIQEFYQLYSELMLKKKTSQYYLFSEDFFIHHAHMLGNKCELARIIDPDSGQLLAATFFLLDKNGWVHYHLSAAQKKAMKLQAMELLIAEAIIRYGQNKYSHLHMGGGHLLDESDGLSRFKSKFSSNRFEFYCTKLICNNETYQKERQSLPLRNPNFFLISEARVS